MVGLTNAQTFWLHSLLAFGRQAQHYVLAKCSLISPIIGPYHQSSVRNKTRVVSKSFFFSFFLSIEYTFRQERINTQTHHTGPIRARSISSRQDSWHVVVFKALSSRQNSGTFTLARFFSVHVDSSVWVPYLAPLSWMPHAGVSISVHSCVTVKVYIPGESPLQTLSQASILKAYTPLKVTLTQMKVPSERRRRI